jgi:hypothetical protein
VVLMGVRIGRNAASVSGDWIEVGLEVRSGIKLAVAVGSLSGWLVLRLRWKTALTLRSGECCGFVLPAVTWGCPGHFGRH